MDRCTTAQEDYLRAISKLETETSAVSTSALAVALGVTRPSVTLMVDRLAEAGLVARRPRAGVRLTAAGRRVALSVHRRHRLVETFLVDVLGLDWSEVHEEAENLEHHLSERVVRAMDRVLRFPKVDPHGHAIPAPDGSVIQRELHPLSSLTSGQGGVIREVLSEEGGRVRRWKELGLVPGARVRVVLREDLDGIWELDVDGQRVVTGREGIEGLRVERARGGRNRMRA